MSTTSPDFLAQLAELATNVSRQHDADVMLYNGTIGEPHDHRLVDTVVARRRRNKVCLILTTYGGDANAAYRIARCLQQHYAQFTVIVAGFCKSAGTLLLLGAHRVVLLEHAELGPLDVQLRKSDELAERSSGLTPMQALAVLQERAFSCFQDNFVRLKFELLLTTRTSAEIATNLASGLYSGIFSQIDPMRLGEMDRAVNIAMRYGERLSHVSKNLKEGALRRLVADYPSHDFIIDREEAREIFQHIDEPNAEERTLVTHIERLCRQPPEGASAFFAYLSHEATDAQNSPQPVGTPVASAQPVEGNHPGRGAEAGRAGERGSPGTTSHGSGKPGGKRRKAGSPT